MWFSTIVLVLITLILVIYESMGIYTARRRGLTKNISRLVTHILMILLLIILFAQIIYFSANMVMLK